MCDGRGNAVPLAPDETYGQPVTWSGVFVVGFAVVVLVGGVPAGFEVGGD